MLHPYPPQTRGLLGLVVTVSADELLEYLPHGQR